MRITAAAVLAAVCLATAVTAATTVLEIADDAGAVTIGNLLDTNLTRKSAGVLGATNLQVDNTLLVAGPTTLGTATVKNSLSVGQGNATVNINGTTTMTGAATHNGATTFNAQATFNNVIPQINTNLYVSGVISHGNAAYHRTRLLGMTVKIYAGNTQFLGPSQLTIVGFNCGPGVTGSGAPNDGWLFLSQQMWQGGDVGGTPPQGWNVQNALSVPTDQATGAQMPGFYRVSGSIHMGGCTEQTGVSSDARLTTFRSLYIVQSYGSATAPTDIRYYGGSTVRELYPKEVSLSTSDVLLMNYNSRVWLGVTNNCVGPSTIATQPPLGPPAGQGGAPTVMSGPHATLSMTYIGE